MLKYSFYFFYLENFTKEIIQADLNISKKNLSNHYNFEINIVKIAQKSITRVKRRLIFSYLSSDLFFSSYILLATF